MSRSGYSDDCEDIWLYRRAVENAIKGKRGQAFLRELLTALDALPQPRLIENDLQDADGEVCAIGSVGLARGADMKKVDPEDPDSVADAFGIARCMAAEIEFVNDDDFGFSNETPEQRFTRVRKWVVENLRTDASQA
jgi:hypothetical protein